MSLAIDSPVSALALGFWLTAGFYLARETGRLLATFVALPILLWMKGRLARTIANHDRNGAGAKQ